MEAGGEQREWQERVAEDHRARGEELQARPEVRTRELTPEQDVQDPQTDERDVPEAHEAARGVVVRADPSRDVHRPIERPHPEHEAAADAEREAGPARGAVPVSWPGLAQAHSWISLGVAHPCPLSNKARRDASAMRRSQASRWSIRVPREQDLRAHAREEVARGLVPQETLVG